MAGLDGLGHRPAGPDRLVVGVGVDGHQGRAVARGVGGHGLDASAHDRDAWRRGGRSTGRPGAATIGRRCQPTRSRVRSPACASSTARRSWPGRTARCSWATSAPTSSRSSRPRATRRAAGARRGSGRPAATATPDGGLLPRGQPQQARPPARPQDRRRRRRSCAGCSPTPMSWSRTSGSAGSPGSASTTTTLRRSTRASSTSPSPATGRRGPAADRPGYDFVIQAASGLMSITGAPDADGGEPTKVGVAISDVVTGMLGAVGVLAALVGRERAGAPVAGRRPADRRLAPRRRPWPASSTRPRTRSSAGVAPGRLGNAHPNIVPYETFATADGAIAVAVGSERQWPRLCAALGLPDAGRRPALRDERRPRRASRRAPPDPRRAVRRAHDRRLARDARGGRDPVRADQRRRRGVRVARGRRARDDGRAGAPGLGRDPPGRRPVRSCPRRRPSIRTPPPTLGAGHRRDPGRARLRRRPRSRGLRGRRGLGLTRLTARAQSSWRRNDQTPRRAATRDRARPSRRPASARPRPSTGAPAPARSPAPPARPAGTARRSGSRPTIDRTSSATNPIPAAAAAEPVTVLPRNVMAAQAARPSQASTAKRDPAADRQRLEQDRGVDPADRDGQDRRDSASTSPMADDLGAEERAARDASSTGRTRPCRDPVPWRRRPSPGRSPRTPRTGRGSSRAGRPRRPATGVGIGIVGSWSPPAALMISGRNLASSGEVSPTSRNSPATIGRRSVRHDSSSSLRTRIARQRRSSPSPAASPSRPTSRRKTSSSVGRTRSNAARRTPAATTSGSSPAEAARLVRDRHDEPARRRRSVTPSTHGTARAGGAASARERRVLARLGLDPVERQRVSGEQLVERPLGHEPAAVHDPDPVADPLDVGEDVGREDDRRARRAGRR